MIFYKFLEGAPLWVWPLLAGFVFLGLRAVKKRISPIWVLYCWPLLTIMPLIELYRMSTFNWVWALFFVFFMISIELGYRFQKNLILHKSDTHIATSGEWLTFMVLMLMFALNFCNGVLQVVNTDLYTFTPYRFLFAAAGGLLTGQFSGRALRVLITEYMGERSE